MYGHFLSSRYYRGKNATICGYAVSHSFGMYPSSTRAMNTNRRRKPMLRRIARTQRKSGSFARKARASFQQDATRRLKCTNGHESTHTKRSGRKSTVADIKKTTGSTTTGYPRLRKMSVLPPPTISFSIRGWERWSIEFCTRDCLQRLNGEQNYQLPLLPPPPDEPPPKPPKPPPPPNDPPPMPPPPVHHGGVPPCATLLL